MFTALLTIVMTLTCILPVSSPRNQPPVATDDEVMVTGYTDYLEIPVFANDYDPEGKPIDVVALGQVDRGKAELLEGDAVGVFPEYPADLDTRGRKPVLIAHGTYVISDGHLTSTGHWYVWYQPATPAD